MSSLVDSTYRALIGRLQRGGTDVQPVSRPSDDAYRWGFQVFAPETKAVSVLVEVGLMTRNVYKNDLVEITISGLVGTQASITYKPVSGNCPPLDTVEAFIRTALAHKQVPQPVLVVEHEAAKEVPPEPERRAPLEGTPAPPLRRKDKSRRGRRTGAAPEAQVSADVAAPEVQADQTVQSEPGPTPETPGQET